jgi:hypothetical protein
MRQADFYLALPLCSYIGDRQFSGQKRGGHPLFSEELPPPSAQTVPHAVRDRGPASEVQMHADIQAWSGSQPAELLIQRRRIRQDPGRCDRTLARGRKDAAADAREIAVVVRIHDQVNRLSQERT